MTTDTPAPPESSDARPAAPPSRPAYDRPQGGRGPGDRPSGGRREGGGGRRFYPRRRVCLFCADKEAVMDFKQPETLRRFISERARIEPRRKTSTCSRHQRALAREIKRARQAGLIPFTTDTLHDMPPAR
ncbi:MAG: 30S ribosomal protein S18 [Chloroflexi bacterium]|nr:30S ribosomal protein S18 [Chloroflexota bacterium]